MKIVDVSIVIANFNNARYLIQFFDSIRNSDYIPNEIIFVDDCSTDNSIEILQTLNFPNLKIYRLAKNVGFSNALNIGVKHAACKYILRIDPDDFLVPERIRFQYEFMEAHKEIDILGSNCYYYNEKLGKTVGASNVKTSHEQIKKRYENGEHGMIHGTIICKSHVLKQNKYLQQNCPAEEYDIFSRLICGGYIFHNLEEQLLGYRIHGNSVSSKMPFSTIKIIARLNTKYFGRKQSLFKTVRMFIFLRNYRNYLEECSWLTQKIYLAICVIVNPSSLVNRVRQKMS